MDKSDFVSISAGECAKILNVHYDTIKSAIYSWRLRGYKVGRRKLRVPEDNFRYFLNNLAYSPNQPQMKEKIKKAIEIMKTEKPLRLIFY